MAGGFLLIESEEADMYQIFYACLTIIWILDILDLPFMDFMDTTIPVNTLAWILIWYLIPRCKHDGGEEHES